MTTQSHDYSDISLWWNTLPVELTTANRPALANDLEVDVAIVGAGYTGLWTAYYLQKRNPQLSIAILESEVVGFGASGRNGGWCSAYFPTSIDKLGRMHGAQQARAMQDAMHDTVTEVENIVASEGIECDWQRGGCVSFARSELQLERAKDYVKHWHDWGYTDADYSFLDQNAVNAHGLAADSLGGSFTTHVAAINPAKLVRQLGNIVESRGATIFENTRVTEIAPHLVTTAGGRVTAKFIVRATEGYTAQIKGMKRDIAPVYSLMIATEPLSEEVWTQIGLAKRETFTDFRNLIIYGQRTSDNRFAFGGRGAPYHFGSTIKTEYDRYPKVHNSLPGVLAEIFPATTGAKITHTWGGPLGIARDWMASAGLDSDTGFAWAGGYVGDGVGTTNLSGRTLADLITGTASDLVTLPWVNHKSRKWEPEPLRWIGANAGLQAMTMADSSENRTGKPSHIADVVGRFVGE